MLKEFAVVFAVVLPIVLCGCVATFSFLTTQMATTVIATLVH